MAEPQPETTEQPERKPARRGADPTKVIDNLTQTVAQQARELAVAYAMVEQQDEELAAAHELADQLRAELVAATSARPAAPKAGTRGNG